MNEKLDEGDIIKQLKFKIPFDWTAKEIIEKIMEI
jgi:methionyl-tRNA formyltransferase